MQISFSPPDIGEGEIESIVKALKSGWITTGPATKRLEKEVAAYCGTPCAVALNSATACLEVVLRILGIGAGDEVITSAYTYSASASVIEHVGAKIVLVDTAKDSYFMDAEKLAAAITAKTKAIIPVDIAGVPCDYDGIAQIVEAKKGLFHASNPMQEAIGRVAIVADAAHSFGGIYKGKRIGTQANFTCFSFHAVKNLTTAEGGAVVWKQNPKINDTQVYKEFMLWSLHGQNKDALSKTQIGAWEYDIERLGYKYNMTDVLASIGLAQLERYEGLLEKRHQIVARYEKALDHPDIDILRHSGDNWRSSGHLFLTRMRGFDEKQRNNFIIKMAERGIATNVHYKPLPMHTAYQKYGFAIADFPNAYAQYANEITLPLHTQLTDGMVDYIAENYLDVLNKGVAQ